MKGFIFTKTYCMSSIFVSPDVVAQFTHITHFRYCIYHFGYSLNQIDLLFGSTRCCQPIHEQTRFFELIYSPLQSTQESSPFYDFEHRISLRLCKYLISELIFLRSETRLVSYLFEKSIEIFKVLLSIFRPFLFLTVLA